MTDIEIQEGNKLIAAYMQIELHNNEITYNSNNTLQHVIAKANSAARFLDEVPKYEFDTSWDWLMPVVENIFMDYKNVDTISVSPGRTRIWFKPHLDRPMISSPCESQNTSIQECWLAVIEFIKWHNTSNS